MKTLKALFLVTLFSFSLFTANASTEPVDSPADLQSQLSEIILQSDAFENIAESTSFKVKIMVTSDSQVLVLSTSEEKFADQLKSILNYTQLDVTPEMHGKVYLLPVRLEKK